jgi:hypothetical protein
VKTLLIALVILGAGFFMGCESTGVTAQNSDPHSLPGGVHVSGSVETGGQTAVH